MVEKFRPACSGFVCDNAKLRDFIASNVSPEAARTYRQHINSVREVAANQGDGVVMKKEELAQAARKNVNRVSTPLIAVGVVVVLAGLVILMRKRRKNSI